MKSRTEIIKIEIYMSLTRTKYSSKCIVDGDMNLWDYIINPMIVDLTQPKFVKFYLKIDLNGKYKLTLSLILRDHKYFYTVYLLDLFFVMKPRY